MERTLIRKCLNKIYHSLLRNVHHGLMGGQAECRIKADTEARTPFGAIGNFPRVITDSSKKELSRLSDIVNFMRIFEAKIHGAELGKLLLNAILESVNDHLHLQASL